MKTPNTETEPMNRRMELEFEKKKVVEMEHHVQLPQAEREHKSEV